MRALISGVPGWLGNRFLEILIKGFKGEGPANDWKLRCLVMEGIDLSFIRQLAKEKEIEIVAGDIKQFETLEKGLKDVDLVFHLAGVIHPKRIRDFYEINTFGTENMLRASAENGVKRFVYVSSGSVGGLNKRRDLPITEEDSSSPYMHYGWSKYEAELAVQNFFNAGRLETVILRPTWFYGPHQPERQTFFFKMIQKGNPIVFGDGGNLRSLSYIDNVCEALLLSAICPGAKGQLYWIVDEHPYSTIEIYKTVAELLEVKNFRPRHVPGLTSEICQATNHLLQRLNVYVKEIHVAGLMNKDITCSIEKARRELGYNPKIGLREGMKRSIEWCQRNAYL